MHWKCIGVEETINKIKYFLSISNRADELFTAYKALKQLDNNITILMDDDDNDKSYLLTYRRQVRTLLRTVTQ